MMVLFDYWASAVTALSIDTMLIYDTIDPKTTIKRFFKSDILIRIIYDTPLLCVWLITYEVRNTPVTFKFLYKSASVPFGRCISD